MPLDEPTNTPIPTKRINEPVVKAKGTTPAKKGKPLKDIILINPDMTKIVQETKETHAVMAFGRMNPPTTGHKALVDKMHEVAKQHNASHVLVASHSQDPKKNPLSGEDKLKHLKRFFPNTHIVLSNKEHPTFLQHAAKLHKEGATHLHMVAGSDRVDEYKQKLNQYNGEGEGKLFNFKHISVHSSGARDPDAEGTEGMSASKMRKHAQNGDFKEFKKGVPSHVSDTHAKELYNDTRKGMKLNEETVSEEKIPVDTAVRAVSKVLGDKGGVRFSTHLRPGTKKHTTWAKINKALSHQGVKPQHIAKISTHVRPAEFKEEVEQNVAEDFLNEMDKSAPQPGRDGRVSHSTYGSRNKTGSDYFTGKEAPGTPVTAAKAAKDALDILKKQGVAEGEKKPHPETWHDVDPKLGKMVDKMSQAEKVKKGWAHPDTLKKKKEQGVAEGLDDIEDTRQFRNAIALAKSQKAIRQAKDGKDAKYYADGTKVTPAEVARRAAERKAKKQGVAEGYDDRKTAPGWHSDSVKNPNFNDELSIRRVSPPGKRLKSGKLSADERGSQERTKALMKFKKAQGGLTGPKGVLPEDQGYKVHDAEHIGIERDKALQERVVGLQQRRARAVQMRRIEAKLKRGRAITRFRLATSQQLKARAYKTAKQNVRSRFAGARGAEYQELGPSDKVSVDRTIDPKIKNIRMMVQRILPKIRQSDVKKVQAARAGKAFKANITTQYNSVEIDQEKFNKLYEAIVEHKMQKLDEGFGMGTFYTARDLDMVAEGGFAMHPSVQAVLDEDAASHLRMAAMLEKTGKPQKASIHRRIAAALQRGDNTTAKGLINQLKSID